MNKLAALRTRIQKLHMADETETLHWLVDEYGLDEAARSRVCSKSAELIRQIRNADDPGLMEVFLAEYGLSTDEGVALMCLAEALLRVPDAQTIDELIEDKIAPSSWGKHLGQSSSSLVNASTWALMLTGKVLKEPLSSGIADILHGAVRRLGEPLIRTAVKQAIREMGHQFVLGRDLDEAIKRARSQEEKGYTYSYDMLGEAALTAKDAASFFKAYSDAIETLTRHADCQSPRKNPGISLKLSALHPRYEVSQHDRIMKELVPDVKKLAIMAKQAHMGFNIDAEESDRLELSLDVIEAVLRCDELAGWSGFGVVVQTYGKQASATIDWLYELATRLDRTIMVRLVKGAYWDSEIKQAQIDGVEDFPVFTNKAATDISYICCARKLLDYADRIYPQFATHNAHTVCAILEMVKDGQAFEFQRLHGMGETLYNQVMGMGEICCRIYAPVGAHRDLLAYLVRRLLENGANSSFVNQIVDEDVAPEIIAADPFEIMGSTGALDNEKIVRPGDIFQPERKNSTGWNLKNYQHIAAYEKARQPFKTHRWTARPVICGVDSFSDPVPVFNPANKDDLVGHVASASTEQVEIALDAACSWDQATASERYQILNRAADLYEENSGELFAALCREAGKTGIDAVAEIREAVDFLRYNANQAIKHDELPARGIITCISPWNFPLAIFTGQISSALAGGNGVLAKPAEPTPIIASIGVRLLHEAGVPADVLQLVLGKGSDVGAKLTCDKRIDGVCFTGSTEVARIIYRGISANHAPDSSFIAETGGLNAMVVDSTALPEQAIRDIVDSAFRSCGQRCSALRIVYLQKDIADDFMEMLFGAMDELEISDPWKLSSDIGPVINKAARKEILDYIEAASAEGRLLKQLDIPVKGLFVRPSVVATNGVLAMEKEVFGPVLHITTFEADEIDQIIADINKSGYGLTFGLHSRIDDRVEHITGQLNVGNIYVNRNQIGAVVGSQPFGGEGLSGTGPKAGGPLYVKRLKRFDMPGHKPVTGENASLAEVQTGLDNIRTDTHKVIETVDLPGPTGESNRWSIYPKGTILCLGPSAADAIEQMKIAMQTGCGCLAVAPGIEGQNMISKYLQRAALAQVEGFDAVALWSDNHDLTSARKALAQRNGPLLPLIATRAMQDFCILERHLCIDTTAAGGNASLLAGQ